jgi:guanylate kinase
VTLGEKKGEIIAVSGPSGGGKTTIVKKILEHYPKIKFSISATTRPKRENEIEEKEYFFISEEEFKDKIEKGEFVEWEKFYDYYYGTFKKYIDDNINEFKSVLVEIDVKGALSIKRIYPDSHLLYIMPPSYSELIKRLKNRKTETEEDLNKRIERAKMELSQKDKFDYIIVNKNLNNAISETLILINNILGKEK